MRLCARAQDVRLESKARLGLGDSGLSLSGSGRSERRPGPVLVSQLPLRESVSIVVQQARLCYWFDLKFAHVTRSNLSTFHQLEVKNV